MLQAVDQHDAVVADEPALSAGYRRYALGVMLCIYALNFLDRQIVAILAEPIRTDLHLADWQIGLMTGLSFALFYTLFGIPVARLAERGNRPLLISGAIGIWSLFTTLCGFAQNFAHLIIARVGVGVGESGCTPAAVSLIADYTPKSRRATAMSIYSLGSPVGTLLGMVMGGLIANAWGWRAAFLVAGIPGILMAVIVALTLVEPRRRMAVALRPADKDSLPARAALKEIRSNGTLWRVIFGGAMIAFVSYGTTAFSGSFFLRNHGPALAQIGAALGTNSLGALGIFMGLAHGIGGGAGALLGGKLVDHFASRDLRAYARVPALGIAIAVPFYLIAFMVPDVVVSFACVLLATTSAAMWGGPVYAAVQGLVRPQSRATATATLLFTTNIIGLGLGPLIIGLVSDLLSSFSHLDPAGGVRVSLMLSTLTGIPAALVYWSAGPGLRTKMVN